MTLTFQELREFKDSLPDGSMHKIAEDLGIDVETVRNYFGGSNFRKGAPVGVHYEQGPGGGIVKLDDTAIFEAAQKLLAEKK